jgi:tetratricopeptide (TPR) repeat protein
MSLYFSRFDFSSSLLAGTTTVAALVIFQPAVLAAKSPQEIAQIGIPVTVQVNPRIDPDVKDGGSGVIINRQGNIYTVLTCNHVVNMPGPLTIRTPDGNSYAATIQERLKKSPDNIDLALITFSSEKDYPVATLANSDPVIGANIFVFGFPAQDKKFGANRDFEFSPGYVTSRPSNAPYGYTLRYNAVSKGGMSGGPVFDVDGRVVGIHGNGSIAVTQGKGKTKTESGAEIPSNFEVAVKTGFNAAIPINTNLARIRQGAASVAVDNSPSTDKPAERLNNPQSPSDYVAKAAVAQEQGNKSQAIESYTQAINRDPNLADAYYHRGNARYDQGDKKGALEDYTKVISLKPDYANAYYQRGVIRFNQGSQKEALEDFNQYISYSPDDLEAYYSRGVIRRELRDYQGMFDDFDQVVRLAPDDARAYYNRGIARSMLRNTQGTLEDFNEALRLDPSSTAIYNTRAIFRSRQGDREGAIADFSEIIRLDPKDGAAYFNRGVVRRRLGARQEAMEDLQTAANLFQQQSDTNNYQKALEELRSLQSTPSVPATQQPEPAGNSDQPTPDEAPTQQSEPSGDSSW